RAWQRRVLGVIATALVWEVSGGWWCEVVEVGGVPGVGGGVAGDAVAAGGPGGGDRAVHAVVAAARGICGGAPRSQMPRQRVDPGRTRRDPDRDRTTRE